MTFVHTYIVVRCITIQTSILLCIASYAPMYTNVNKIEIKPTCYSCILAT